MAGLDKAPRGNVEQSTRAERVREFFKSGKMAEGHDPEHIDLLMTRLLKDGYPVSENYLAGAYIFSGYKFLLTIKSIKTAIDMGKRILPFP